MERTVTAADLYQRFKSPGWRYQGKTDIGCPDCKTAFEVFRKPYKTTKGDYENFVRSLVAVPALSFNQAFEQFQSLVRELFR
jgi:hypothetical protein